MAWFRDTSLSLEKLKTIHLDPQLIAEQLYEQKVGTLHKFNWFNEQNVLSAIYNLIGVEISSVE